MTSKEELLKRFKEERIAREKARIQMLHDMNRKKYSKHDEDAWKYPKSNSSLNISDDKAPVKNSIYKRGPSFVRAVRPRVKKYNSLHNYVENCLNVTAPPVSSSVSIATKLTPKRRSMYSTAEHNASVECSSPTTTTDVGK